MAKNKKMTPLRFLRRNTLNILLVLMMLALLVGIALVARQMLDLMQTSQPPAQTEQDEQQSQPDVPPEEQEDPVQPDEQEDPAQPDEDMPVMFIPPFDGETAFLANDKLALTYDASALSLSEQDGVYTLLDITGPLLPRMELQALEGSMEALSIEERRSLAIGLLQAYYYLPPAAELVAYADEHDTLENYRVTLTCEPYREASAMTAKVRLMQIGEELWYAIELLPEGAEHAAMTQAFDNLVIR